MLSFLIKRRSRSFVSDQLRYGFVKSLRLAPGHRPSAIDQLRQVSREAPAGCPGWRHPPNLCVRSDKAHDLNPEATEPDL